MAKRFSKKLRKQGMSFWLLCTCNPNKSYVKMPVSDWSYIPTSLPQELASKTKW